MKINAKDLIPLLGKTSYDPDVKTFLASVGITKAPKLAPQDFHAYVSNKKIGLEITFRDEAHIKVKPSEYDEGSLVLVNMTLYADDSTGFKPFAGELPHGLRFDFELKECIEKIGKPAWKSKDIANVRWDFKGYSVLVAFDKEYEIIFEVSLQLPKLYS